MGRREERARLTASQALHETLKADRLTPRRTALVAAAKTGSPAFTIWPNDTAPKCGVEKCVQ